MYGLTVACLCIFIFLDNLRVKCLLVQLFKCTMNNARVIESAMPIDSHTQYQEETEKMYILVGEQNGLDCNAFVFSAV